MNPDRCPVVVLISGNGSNLQALLDRADECAYRIVGVISNRPRAYGLQRAKAAGIPSSVLDHRRFDSREAFDQALMTEIDAHAPELVVLAGFMRILTPAFVQHYRGRMLNIHPSLLPDYRGIDTHRRVLEAGETRHGVSVHFVTEELDGGPIIIQAVVPVAADDDVASLSRKVASREHSIYPEVVDWFARGRLRMHDNRAWLDGECLPPEGVQRN